MALTKHVFIYIILLEVMILNKCVCIPLEDSEETDYDMESKIINGEKAVRGQFPYQTAMKIDNKQFCGGSLISNLWVLTAAHCAYKYVEAVIYLGAQDLRVEEEGRLTMRCREMVSHEKYNEHLNNDVALIKLLYKVSFTDYIKPVSLPRRSDIKKSLINETVIVSGWGKIADENEYVHQELHYINLTIIPNEECVKHYKHEVIVASTMCAIGQNTKSTCQGDSGGGLVIKPNEEYIHVGVVSFGSQRGCALGIPSGYARTSFYLDWISEKTGIKTLD